MTKREKVCNSFEMEFERTSRSTHSTPTQTHWFRAACFVLLGGAASIAFASIGTASPAQAASIFDFSQDRAEKAEEAQRIGGAARDQMVLTEDGHVDIDLKIANGEPLESLLRRAGILEEDRDAVLVVLNERIDAESLEKGTKVSLTLVPDLGDQGTPLDGPMRLLALHMQTGPNQEMSIVAGGPEGTKTENSKEWSVQVVTERGQIGEDFAKRLAETGVPDTVAQDVLVAVAHNPELPKNIPSESTFSIAYQVQVSNVSSRVEHALLFASLDVSDKEYRVYRYEMPSGAVAYTDAYGKGIASVSLASPLDKFVLTSPHGWRIHPVLGSRRFHRGVDLAAPVGTPVKVAGSGEVIEMKWRTGYGRRMVVRHSDGLETAYNHLSGYAKNLKVGDHVDMGEVVAFVGATGRVTGPHLDYEVKVDGKYVDPMQVTDITVPVDLKGKAFAAFQSFVQQVEMLGS